MSLVLAAVLGYLLGAIPFGLIIGRLTKGIDLREYGSHRTGATNALRTLGTPAAAAVFVLDLAKGVAAVLLARTLFGGDPMVEWAAAAAGVAAIVGHNWSVFIGFTGGRGVATSAGALGAMSPWAIVIVAPIVLLTIWRSRYVSLGSVTGALGAPIITAALATIGAASVPAIAYTLASGLLVTMAHADNIGRLRAGTERKIGQKELVSPHG
ncbi:MAG: acyl phosphate:glycerol-3-phosphate acyltransferase [Chloroflexota bacterium]|jgi:glycerol-3-phosphate acyltransferase PlsY|nr:acyl phosphate:glycerol-3-phosphate acyltransferase [Chloroflexota bacterium]